MGAPAVTSVSYDKASYNPGDLITATVQGAAGSQLSTQTFSGTGTLTDKATGQTGSLKATFTVTEPVEDATAASFADDGGRVWVLVSISQTAGGAVTAVFTATA